MKEFISTNRRTIAAVVILCALYGASKFPGLEAERELLEQLWALLVMGAVVAVPSFRKSKTERASDE